MARRRPRLEWHTWGALPLVNRFLDSIGFDAVLDRFLGGSTDSRQKLPAGRAIGVLVRNLLLSRRPLYAVSEWAASIEPALLGLSPEQKAALNDDRIGRALDRLFDVDRPALVLEIVTRAVRAFGVRLKELHNDSTTVTFHGLYRLADGRKVRGKKTPLVTWGHNKDHRPDLKQLLWTLTVTSDGAVPIHYQVWDGNTPDDLTHEECWEVACQVVGGPRFLYVSDSKLCNARTMRHIDRRGGRFLTILPRTRKEDRAFREYLQTHEVGWRELWRRKGIRGRRDAVDVYSGYPSPVPSAEGFRIVWIHTTEKERQDAEQRGEAIREAQLALEELRRRLASPRCRMKTRTAVDRAVQAALGEARRWIEVDITEQEESRFKQEHRGRPGKKTRYRRTVRRRFAIGWKVRQDMVAADGRADGVFPLITNDRKMAMKALLLAYKRQPDVEKRHEQLKNAHDVAPQYLKSVARIDALLSAFFFALLADALVERELRRGMKRARIKSLPLYPERRECKNPTTERVLELFEGIQVHRLYEGRRPAHVFGANLTRLQRRILRLLGVPTSCYTAR